MMIDHLVYAWGSLCCYCDNLLFVFNIGVTILKVYFVIVEAVRAVNLELSLRGSSAIRFLTFGMLRTDKVFDIINVKILYKTRD